MYWANLFILLFSAYFIAGALFAVFFVFTAVQRVDSLARQAGIGFRLLILPGSALFWPLLLKRCLRPLPHPPVERNGHRLRVQVPR